MDPDSRVSYDRPATGNVTGESYGLIYHAHPLTGNPLFVSSEVENIFGFTPDEWLTDERLWKKRIHPDDRKRVSREFEDAKIRIEDTFFVYRILTRDGSVRWVEDHIKWEKDEKGKPIKIKGKMYTIFQRREEEAGKEREHALTRAVNRLLTETLSCRSDEEVARSALATAQELTGSKSGFVARPADENLLVVAASGEEWKSAEIPRLRLNLMEEWLKSLGVWEKILTVKKPLIINHFEHHFHLEMPPGHPPVASLLAVPLSGEEEVYGTIVLADKEGGYDLCDQEAVESFAAVLTEALTRKEIEQELIIKDKAIESSLDGIAIADFKGILTYVNPSFLSMWRFETAQEVIGKAAVGFWKSKQRAQEALEETIKMGESTGELTARRKDGSEFETRFSARAVRDESMNIICIMAVFEDITLRKQTELARKKLLRGLRERVKELRCLYTIGELTREKDTAIDELLERIVNILPMAFQYPSKTGVRIVFEDFIFETPNFRETEWSLKESIVVDRETRGSVEVCCLKERPQSDKSPFLEEEGIVVRSVVNRVASFVERRRAEERLRTYSTQLEKEVKERTRELREAQEELVRKEKLAVMGQLAGSVGHELRNPLSVIGNSAYFIKMKLDPENELIRKHLDIIQENVLRTNNIISELLGFSRTGTPFLAKTDINTDIVTILSSVEIPETITVETALDVTLPPVSADVDQLQRAILNLILNAIQSMPEGGTLKIETYLEDGAIHIAVQDTGQGIPEENRDRVFEPLFTTRAKGIGLGLAIVKSIVEGHQGSIQVQSEIGKGTTFDISLPVQ
ncbi:MAG: PAS domain-containing protein [Theionarchaea archaeon]|nr:PAS domain-containing protein [Theionarchaea archaeon]